MPQRLTWEEYDAIAGEDGHVLVDVREDSEWASGHSKSALHIPLGALALRARNLITDPSTPIIVCCRSGGRAAHACGALLDLGYQSVAYVSGDAGARYDTR